MEGTIEITIKINEVEEKFLAELLDLGFHSEEEVLRTALRLMHKKEFPFYKKVLGKKVEEAGMTPEERCKKQMGEIITDKKGNRICVVKNGSLETRFSL